ncbi:MAG: hypothetical protein JST27_10010, partial [Bacteroidetes bacterium]|nr:hypothetical protein [Bacteroidota bacterium]
MFRFFFILSIICSLAFQASAHNLFIPANNANLVKYPVIELHGSIYYLSVRLDSPAASLPYVSYYFSRVDLISGVLQRTVQIFCDTAFSNDEIYQSNAVSYCVDSNGRGFNFFVISDDDSSSKFRLFSLLWQYPKSIRFFQVDTSLTLKIPHKKIVERQAHSRYKIWGGAGFSQSLNSNKHVFSYTVSDTITNISTPNSSAEKLLIVDDTGKVIEDKFLGFEPTGVGSTFPNHSSGFMGRINGGFFVSRVLFQDSIFSSQGFKLIVVDTNLNLIDTADSPTLTPVDNSVSRKIDAAFMQLSSIFFSLPSGTIACYSSGAYSDSVTDSIYRYYALAKGSLHPGYHITTLYFPPKASGQDYEHSAHEGFPGALYNPSDNRIYSFSATETRQFFPEYCMNGQPNLGQLVCVDT